MESTDRTTRTFRHFLQHKKASMQSYLKSMTKLLVFIFVFTAFRLHAQQAFPGFMENTGQRAGTHPYKIDMGMNSVSFSRAGVLYNVVEESAFHNIEEGRHTGNLDNVWLKGHCVAVTFQNANTETMIKLVRRRKSTYNYFLGNDPATWRTQVGIYDGLQYESLYKNIDLIYYIKQGRLEYDFILKPMGDAADIKLRYAGQTEMKLRDGRLVLTTSVGEIYESAPVAYQVVGGERRTVACAYQLNGNVLSFVFPNGYDKSRELVIDPTIVFSTYSPTSTALLSSDGATYDSQGNMYVASGTISNLYVSTPGAYVSPGTSSAFNMVIEKYAANGTTFLYGSVIGGTTNGSGAAVNYPYSLFCDSNDNLFILGTSDATNFPVVSGCYKTTGGGTGNDDYVVCKLNSAGGTLLSSTYLGGNQGEGNGFQNSVSAIYIDSNNDVYVSGLTKSSNYPVTPGVFQPSLSGNNDGVITKMNNNLSTLVWSSYIGGSADDDACDIKIAPNGDVYVCGNTRSNNFPGTSGGLHPSAFGAQDGFVARINATATSILQSTYLGTTSSDNAKFLAVDGSNEVYVCGSTTHSSYPVSAGAYSAPGVYNYFIHKLNTNLNTTVFSCALGGQTNAASNVNEFVPTAFGIDQCGNMYFSGNNLNGGLPLTPNALSSASKSIYIASLLRNGTTLLFGTYYGGLIAGTQGSHIHLSTNNRINPQGILFHTECTLDQNYQLSNQISADNNGFANNNAASFKMDLGFLNTPYVATIPQSQVVNPTCGNSNGSASVTVTGGSGNYTYQWLPSGGSAAGATNLAAGTYSVIITDLNSSCGSGKDTLSVTLTDGNNNIIVATATQTNAACGSNNGAIDISASGATSSNYVYTWNPNVSGSSQASGLAGGTYTVIVSEDAVNCPAISDTVVVSITSGSLQASYTATNVSCYNGNNGSAGIAVSGNTGAVTYQWSNGIQSSTGNQLTASTYTVTVTDALGCQVNVVFSIGQPASPTISTSTLATSQGFFSATANVSGLASPLTYQRSSQPVQTTQTAVNLPPGTYTVLVTGQDGCSVSDIVTFEGELVIPNVITPNGDRVNDVFYIKNLPAQSALQIYNRWGNKLFETDDYANNWSGPYADGTYFYILRTPSGKQFQGFFQLFN